MRRVLISLPILALAGCVLEPVPEENAEPAAADEAAIAEPDAADEALASPEVGPLDDTRAVVGSPEFPVVTPGSPEAVENERVSPEAAMP